MLGRQLLLIHIYDCFFFIFLGRIINHELKHPDSIQIAELMKTTEKLWDNHFPEEPYRFSYKNNKVKQNFVSNISYDIEAASKRQQIFFYQVKKK